MFSSVASPELAILSACIALSVSEERWILINLSPPLGKEVGMEVLPIMIQNIYFFLLFINNAWLPPWHKIGSQQNGFTVFLSIKLYIFLKMNIQWILVLLSHTWKHNHNNVTSVSTKLQCKKHCLRRTFCWALTALALVCSYVGESGWLYKITSWDSTCR